METQQQAERKLKVLYDESGISLDKPEWMDEWEEEFIYEDLNHNMDDYLDKGFGEYEFAISNWIPDYDEYGKPDGGCFEIFQITYTP